MSKSPESIGSCISLREAISMPVNNVHEHHKSASKPKNSVFRTSSAPATRTVKSKADLLRRKSVPSFKTGTEYNLDDPSTELDTIVDDDTQNVVVLSTTDSLAQNTFCANTSVTQLPVLEECDQFPINKVRRMSSSQLLKFVRKSLKRRMSFDHESSHTVEIEQEVKSFRHFKPIHPKRMNVLSNDTCGVSERQPGQPGLMELLTSKDYRGNVLRQALLRYSKEQYCEENLLFLQDFLSLKETDIENYNTKTQQLIDTYIKDAAVWQINIPGPMREAAITSSEKGELSTLNEALAQIAQQTTRNFSIGVYKPFLKSKNYRSSIDVGDQ